MSNPTSSDRFLRNSLRANATFSLVSGATFSLAGAPIAEFLGVAPAALVTSVGLNLLGFAAALVWLASRPVVSLSLAKTVIGLDIGWIVGTIVLVYADVFTRGGALASLLVASVVLSFALLQWIGVRRVQASQGGAAAEGARAAGARGLRDNGVRA